MMLQPKDRIDNSDLFSMTNKLVNHRIWPIPDVQIHEKWTRDAGLQPIISRPIHPRAPADLHTDGFIDRHGTINDDNRESFHCAIGPILVAARCFGILPLAGLLSETPKKLVFKKISLITFHAVVVMLMLLTISTISIIHTIQTLKADNLVIEGGIEAAAGAAFFYCSNSIYFMIFFSLAPRWISLQRDWRTMERDIDRGKYRSPKLRWKFSMITTFVMISALVEHSFSIVNSLSPTIRLSTSNWTFEELFEDHITNSHSFFFTVCHSDYNFGVGILIFCSSKIATFTWNFADVFIILNSTGLAERYKSLNQRLIGDLPNYPRNIDWREIRECYASLSTLVKNVDKNISPIILSSFANNLYAICVQLLHGLSPRENNILDNVYFFGSFVFLVGRTVAVTLFTARIHDQSKLALSALYNCPGAAYNLETQRLLQQLTTDEVCLTGLRFFSITRNFMLAIAGAIVTYEVVLLQFNVTSNK